MGDYINSDRFLYVLNTDPERWADRYGLLPFSAPCDQCGATLTTTVPFVQGTLRGLRAPRCDCGHELTPFCLVRDPKYGDLFSD